jgi:hypothetical protein
MRVRRLPEPEPVNLNCAAELQLGDDYGDNVCTCRCTLHPGHAGPHEERFERNGKPVLIQFECDDRSTERRE